MAYNYYIMGSYNYGILLAIIIIVTNLYSFVHKYAFVQCRVTVSLCLVIILRIESVGENVGMCFVGFQVKDAPPPSRLSHFQACKM